MRFRAAEKSFGTWSSSSAAHAARQAERGAGAEPGEGDQPRAQRAYRGTDFWLSRLLDHYNETRVTLWNLRRDRSRRVAETLLAFFFVVRCGFRAMGTPQARNLISVR